MKLKGVDGYLNNAASANGISLLLIFLPLTLKFSKPAEEWEEAFRNVIIKNNKQTEEQLTTPQQQIQLPLELNHPKLPARTQEKQEDFIRTQEIQKRKTLLNNIGLSQMNGPHNGMSYSLIF